jgi:hypothetical protein
MSNPTEPAAPAIAHVKRRIVPDDLNSTTTFRWTPPEASSWGKARLAAWEGLSTAVRSIPSPGAMRCRQCSAARRTRWRNAALIMRRAPSSQTGDVRRRTGG